jgi:nucleoside-diphosphate-sugar epimerase
VRALLERGDAVRVLDNFATGNRANLLGLEEDVEVVEGELRSYERVHNAVRGVELVFHQGALPSVPRSVQDPLTTSAVTIEGTLNVLLAARDESVRRVVFASSSSVYGNTGTLPRTETQQPDPISPYAVAKLAAERYCVSFHRVYGLETVALRYFNVFGPRQDPGSPYSGVISLFVKWLLAGERPTIYGDGEQTRDFTYVANVVDGVLRACEAPGASGESINVATEGRISLNQLLRELQRVIGTDLQPIYGAPRVGDVRDSQASIAKARRILGYEPTVSFEEGLRHTVAWFREG